MSVSFDYCCANCASPGITRFSITVLAHTDSSLSKYQSPMVLQGSMQLSHADSIARAHLLLPSLPQKAGPSTPHPRALRTSAFIVVMLVVPALATLGSPLLYLYMQVLPEDMSHVSSAIRLDACALCPLLCRSTVAIGGAAAEDGTCSTMPLVP